MEQLFLLDHAQTQEGHFSHLDSFNLILRRFPFILFIFAFFERYQGDGSTHSAVMPTDGSTVDIVAGIYIFLFTSVIEELLFQFSLFQPKTTQTKNIQDSSLFIIRFPIFKN